jgi:hypothetical protein
VDHGQNLPLRFTLVTSGSFKSSLILSNSPMYSSSAYPTPIPSSDLVTKDRPATHARIETRRQDKTAGFPVGLIPQLIDVLRILTEGQDLLSRKIRAARHDDSSHSVPIVERLECFQIPGVQPIVSSGSDPLEAPPTPPSEDIEFDGETTRANTFGIGRPSNPDIEVGGLDTPPARVPDSATPFDSPAVTTINAMGDPSCAPVAQSAPLDSVPPAETTASPLRRNYNFFDELDARLAGLQHPTV